MIVLLPALTLALAQSADAGAVARLTLAEALERARTASPRLGQLRALADVADAGAPRRARRSAAHPGRLRRLQPQLERARVRGPAADRPPSPSSRTCPTRARTRADLGLPLYTGGRTSGALTAAEEQGKAAALDAAAGAGATSPWRSRAAYWGLVAQRESERVLREAIASYEAHLKDATNFFENGMTARNEVLSVQVERDRAELARLRGRESAAEVGEREPRSACSTCPRARECEPVEEGAACAAETAAVEAMVQEARPRVPNCARSASRAWRPPRLPCR